MKNLIKDLFSKRMFGISYDELPLASELIVDLQIECITNKVLALLLSAALVFSIVGGVICSMA